MDLMVPQNFSNRTVFMEIIFFLTQREMAMATLSSMQATAA